MRNRKTCAKYNISMPANLAKQLTAYLKLCGTDNRSLIIQRALSLYLAVASTLTQPVSKEAE